MLVQVVLTDYPDRALVDNMVYNVAQNGVRDIVAVRGYVWGRDVEPLLAATATATDGDAPRAKFDLILLSDLVFNHSEVGAPPFSAYTKRGISDTLVWGFLLASRAALDV